MEVPASQPTQIVVTQKTCKLGREYFVFAPPKIDPNKAYWLVVHVHGYRGSGSAKAPLKSWVDRGDCIGVAPSFPDGFQGLDLSTDKQLIDVAQTIGKEYKLQPRLFLIGHSGGAQFVHRFALKYPDLVAGCVATSAGSWDLGRLNRNAAATPFAISCGEKDTALSVPESPFGRLEFAKEFEKSLSENHFLYTARYWPNAGHGGNKEGQAKMADECFSLATTGLIGTSREEFDKKLAEINQQATQGNRTQAQASLKKLSNAMLSRKPAELQEMLSKSDWKVGPAGLQVLPKITAAYLADRDRELADRESAGKKGKGK